MRRVARQTQAQATQNGFAVANLATGALLGAADAATNPIGTIRRQAERLSRRGEPTNRQLARSAARTGDSIVETGTDVASGRLPERFALESVRLVKRQARRDNFIGDVAFGTLSTLNKVIKRTIRTLNRFEDTSEPPVRDGERRSTSTRTRRSSGSARSRRASGGRSSSTGASSTRRSGATRSRAKAQSNGSAAASENRKPRTRRASRSGAGRTTRTRRQNSSAETQRAQVTVPETPVTPELTGAVEVQAGA